MILIERITIFSDQSRVKEAYFNHVGRDVAYQLEIIPFHI